MIDAIIIGGGHNGLVCAAYLAKAGRKVTVLDARAMGNIATVWVQIDTRRQMKGKEEIASATANHVYLMILTPDGWKIAGIADNRAIDEITG